MFYSSNNLGYELFSYDQLPEPNRVALSCPMCVVYLVIRDLKVPFWIPKLKEFLLNSKTSMK
jgi:hypothetical protein